MYEIIKQILESGDFELEVYTNKINVLWARNQITDAEQKELLELAQKSIKDETGTAPEQEQLNELYNRMSQAENDIKELKQAIQNLSTKEDTKEEGKTEDPTEPQEQPSEGELYPGVEWFTKPTNTTNAYVYGDVIKYTDKKGNTDIYVCTRKGKKVMYDPEFYPIGWTKITEDQYNQIKDGQLLEDVLNPKSDGEA